MHACVCYQQQKQSGPPQISFQNPFFSTLEDYMRHFHNSMMMIQGTQSCLRPILESDRRHQILASSNLVQETQEIPPNSTPCIKLVIPQGPTTTRQVLVRGWLVPIASGALLHTRQVLARGWYVLHILSQVIPIWSYPRIA
jgi:hypothetical protein